MITVLHACSTKADTITVIGEPASAGQGNRDEAIKVLTDSLRAIALEAQKAPALQVAIEPLDVAAHKRNSLGYTKEAHEVNRVLKNEGFDVSLLLDSAHMTLNGEDLLVSLQEVALPRIGRHRVKHHSRRGRIWQKQEESTRESSRSMR